MKAFQSSALDMAQDALNSAKQSGGDFGDYKLIENMAVFVANSIPKVEGERHILINQFVVFDASVMSLPKAQKSDYINMAMEMTKIEPMPIIEHSMFLEVASDLVVPVYVEKSLVEELEHLKESYGAEELANVKLRFAGIHVYNYSKGPAIVVESVAASK